MHMHVPSLVVGTVCGILTAWTAALVTQNFIMTCVAVVLTAVSVCLLVLCIWFQTRSASKPMEWIHDAVAMLAFAYAACVGSMAATALSLPSAGDIRVLVVAYALVFASGIALRNAGRPLVAFGQLLLTLVPIFAMCVITGSEALLALAAILPGIALGMGAVTIKVFKTLAQQAGMAEECRSMADLLQRQAHEDAVTGLLNRAGLQAVLEPVCDTLADDEHFALFWLDLHRFKEVNKSLGHAVGDLMLNDAARRLEQSAPEASAIARFGSDEFVMGVRVASRAAAEVLAQTISDNMARPVRVAGNRIESGAAIGVSLLPHDASSLGKLMQAADLALFHAKLGERHSVRFFDNAMTRELVRRKEIESELRSAIAKDQLAIFFQPIVDLETGRVDCFEALARWFHPQKGELKPDEFIPIAEETGLIITLGNWITAQAARTAASWPEHVKLAVNLSPVQIKAPGAALGILAALKEAGLDPHRLELEVTESLFLEDDDHTARFMEELSSKGVRFALDDFGTGYSALHYINKYPFRKIKVDRSFVSGPNAGRRSDAIIRAVAEMGATLDMEIVAEGLETIEQVQFVRQAGCTLGQGFYFSRAVPDYLAAILLAQESEDDTAARLAS